MAARLCLGWNVLAAALVGAVLGGGCANASSPGTSGPCGPVGARCDPKSPACECPRETICHGLVCADGHWAEAEMFPVAPGP